MPAECRGRAFRNSDLTMRNLLISLAIIAIFLEISGLIWSAKEGQPSEAYRQLSQPPERRTDNPLNNGYFMMVGFAAAVAEDPVGHRRRPCLHGVFGLPAVMQAMRTTSGS